MQRKLKKIGGSLFVPFPPDFAEAMDLKPEDVLELVFDGKELCVRKA